MIIFTIKMQTLDGYHMVKAANMDVKTVIKTSSLTAQHVYVNIGFALNAMQARLMIQLVVK
jgi:hypothetical protein